MGKAAKPQGRASRWLIASDELVWVFELNRGAAWARWSPIVGCAVRAWRESDPTRVADCDVQVDYALLPLGVPAEAVGSRFDDHRSYFTMVFDHTHDLVADDVRANAFAYMAQDMHDLATRLSTVASLRQAVRQGLFDSGFVDRRLASQFWSSSVPRLRSRRQIRDCSCLLPAGS